MCLVFFKGQAPLGIMLKQMSFLSPSLTIVKMMAFMGHLRISEVLIRKIIRVFLLTCTITGQIHKEVYFPSV